VGGENTGGTRTDMRQSAGQRRTGRYHEEIRKRQAHPRSSRTTVGLCLGESEGMNARRIEIDLQFTLTRVEKLGLR
jgi:hypothetical protein